MTYSFYDKKREPGEAFIKCHLREYITIKYSPQGGRKEEKNLNLIRPLNH